MYWYYLFQSCILSIYVVQKNGKDAKKYLNRSAENEEEDEEDESYTIELVNWKGKNISTEEEEDILNGVKNNNKLAERMHNFREYLRVGISFFNRKDYDLVSAFI